MSIMSIGVSGMRAASARLQAASSNITNMHNNGRVPTAASPRPGDVYQPIDVAQHDQSSQGRPGGVGFSYVTQKGAYSMISDPNSPFADAKGMVATPDIDLATELVNVIMAQAAFAAATKIVTAGDEMMKTAINILA
jgi:flagellar basal-body rod protein FlgC